MNRRRKMFRRCVNVVGGLFILLALAFLIYFPGRQSLLAVELASGFGVEGLQEEVDALEAKAIAGETFTADDKVFLRNLYTCFAKGARLTVVLRQSARLMDHYLARSGEDLRIEPRIFLGSGRVQEEIAVLKEEIAADFRSRNAVADRYSSDDFYMGDPTFFDSYVGLYFGRLVVHPRLLSDGMVLHWRAEMPWQWPSYQSLRAEYGDGHAQCFPLPNLRSLLQGSQHGLTMDDGLGEHLVQLGLAKPFLVYSEWEEKISASQVR